MDGNKVIKIADYLIHIANKSGDYKLTAVKLHKMLYYALGFHWIWDNELLFDEDIEVGGYGPVVREVHEAYTYTQQDGTLIYPEDLEAINSLEVVETSLNESEKKSLMVIWETYKRYTNLELIDITRKEEPWLKSKEENKEVINTELIKEYFVRAYK